MTKLCMAWNNLTLVRKTDDDAIFRGAAGARKDSLDKISWFKPHVIPAYAEKFSIYNTIESKVKLPVAYRFDKFHMATERKDSSGETEIYYCWFPNG